MQATTARLFNWMAWLAAPRWSVLFFVITALAAYAVVKTEVSPTFWMAAPFFLLIANLVAAIIAKPRFRADLPLLIFHLALLALVSLIFLGRLTYLDGNVALTQGESLESAQLHDTRGPWHQYQLAKWNFTNAGFEERFRAQGRYPYTYNRVRWQDDQGKWNQVIIGDDRPLILEGYRIYTNSNRGLTPRFIWHPRNGVPEQGHVQIDSHLSGTFARGVTWQLSQGPQVWARVEREPYTQEPGKPRTNLGAQSEPHRLILRIAEQRYELLPGESVELAEGRLHYLQLDSWMGYRIISDPTRNWVLATVLVAVVSLVWFYWGRLFRSGGVL